MKKLISQLGFCGAAALMLIAFTGPSTMGVSADSIVGGGGRCVVDNACPQSCSTELYTFCADTKNEEDWCMEFGWSPCGDVGDCINYTVAMGSTCTF